MVNIWLIYGWSMDSLWLITSDVWRWMIRWYISDGRSDGDGWEMEMEYKFEVDFGDGWMVTWTPSEIKYHLI